MERGTEEEEEEETEKRRDVIHNLNYVANL